MKKFLSAAVCLLIMMLFCVPVFADDSGYYIKNYDVQATLREDNTVQQTETITVHYNEPRHGIFRAFPKQVKVSRVSDAGREKVYSYRIKVTDVSVAGAPFDAYSEDGYAYIKIGDADSTVMDDVTYTISFVYDVGDDRISDYDEIFYSINGPDWDTYIENFTFNFNFAKPIPQDAVDTMGVFSGSYGAIGNDYIEWTATENGVSGHSIKTLPSQTAVTVQTYLPEGYFVGERMYSTMPAIIAGILLGIASLAVLMIELFARNKRPVQTVEFYPPDGISSADVGYIIDEASDDKDIISLVIWFADKGYLTIAEVNANKKKKKKKMQLTKVKELPGSAPKYQRKFFNALFSSGDVAFIEGRSTSFYEAFLDSKEQLAEEFVGEKALHTKHGELFAFILPAIVLVLYVVFTSLAPAGTVGGAMILPIISAGFLAIVLFIAICVSVRWTFGSITMRILSMVGIAFLAFLSFCVAVFQQDDYIINTTWGYIAFAATLIVCILAPRLASYTDYRTEMAGKLLGLRNFIQKAEVDRLKKLAEEDPEYYYSIIPYAYVFGLSNVWAKKFESIAVPPPYWYASDNDELFNMMMFNTAMNSSFNSSLQSVHTTTSSSGSGGSFGGGGGGFSGGGFGGGGGGSW